MNFTRMKKRGFNQNANRVWFDDTRHYRISWRRVVHGVEVPAAFFACVKCRRFDGETWWDFAAHRRPLKTMKAAIEACEKNKRIWDAFIELGNSGGRRLDRLRALQERSKSSGGMLQSTPVWVEKHADPTLLNMMNPRTRARVEDDEECDEPNQPEYTSPSLTSEAKSPAEMKIDPTLPHTPVSGPASGAMPAVGSSSPRKARKPAKNETPSPARPVKEPATPPVKPSKPSTTASRPSTRPKSPSGKRSAKRTPPA